MKYVNRKTGYAVSEVQKVKGTGALEGKTLAVFYTGNGYRAMDHGEFEQEYVLFKDVIPKDFGNVTIGGGRIDGATIKPQYREYGTIT